MKGHRAQNRQIKHNNIYRIIIMIISKILSPSESSGSHTSLGRIYLPMSSQDTLDFIVEVAVLVNQRCQDPGASDGQE